jgi:hypothetical protein
MYIFEVEKTLTQSDLSNIWQNVMPQSLNYHTTGSYTISHTIDRNEMLSSLNIRPGETIKFMCFKVKQRGISKYEFSNYDDEQVNKPSVANTRMLKQKITRQKLNPIVKEIDKQLNAQVVAPTVVLPVVEEERQAAEISVISPSLQQKIDQVAAQGDTAMSSQYRIKLVETFKKFQKEAYERKANEYEDRIREIKESRAQAISDGDGQKVNALDDALTQTKHLQKILGS